VELSPISVGGSRETTPAFPPGRIPGVLPQQNVYQDVYLTFNSTYFIILLCRMFIYPALSVKPAGIAANMTLTPRSILAAPAGLPMAARDVLMQYGESLPGW
jgi:hypothetical protein